MEKRLLRRSLMALLLSVASALPLQAASASGNDLYQNCQDDGVALAACVGYVTGIADALSAGAAIDGWRACPSGEVTRGQLKDVVVRFLGVHPEWRHFTDASLVAHALSAAFPCQ